MDHVGAPLSTLPPPAALNMPRLNQFRLLSDLNAASEVCRERAPVVEMKFVPARIYPPAVFVTSPQGARDVLGAGPGVMDKRAPIFVEGRKWMGENMFNLPDDEWLPRRRTVQPLFTKQSVREFACHMTSAVSAVEHQWVDADVIDLDRECRQITINALSRAVLGTHFEATPEIERDIRTILSRATARAVRPVNAPMWSPSSAQRRAKKARDRLRALASGIVSQCVAEGGVDAPLVRRLLSETDAQTGQPLDAAAVADELLVYLVAGHDTTATNLTYALWQLGRNPLLQEAVRSEVSLACADEVSVEDIPALQLTARVLHEALRLCPPASLVSRLAMEDVEVDGYRVAAGSNCVVGVFAIQRDPKLWDQPTTFDPDRFTGDWHRSIDRWQYLPFGAGRRSCIGGHFAMLEATIVLASIVRSFDISSVGDDFPMAVPFTNVAAAPIPARLRRLPD